MAAPSSLSPATGVAQPSPKQKSKHAQEKESLPAGPASSHSQSQSQSQLRKRRDSPSLSPMTRPSNNLPGAAAPASSKSENRAEAPPSRPATSRSSSSTAPAKKDDSKNDNGAKSTSIGTEDAKTMAKGTEEGNNSNRTEDSPARNHETAEPSPKKRRKVNHACVYCRRSHMTCDSGRPCRRCIKRNIPNLCHDEPREPAKRIKTETEGGHSTDEETGVPLPANNEFTTTAASLNQPAEPGRQVLPDNGSSTTLGITPSSSSSSRPLPEGSQALQQPTAGTAALGQDLDGNTHSLPGPATEWNNLNTFNNYPSMRTFHPSYMFNAPEVTNEYNLLGDFLSNSLLDDGAMFNGEDLQGLYADPSLLGSLATGLSAGNNAQFFQSSSSASNPNNGTTTNANNNNLAPSQAAQGNAITRPGSTNPNDKAREKYFLTAADPSGNDPPEQRMEKLLKAKYDAGLLKPFNYVKGYARLNTYMERNMQTISRQKILRQLDKFRPKFRERMHALTDMELVLVEMWFERELMKYDRVFASMAVPACCWRRTGEIFRGNKEMAELIHVPIESLRDGKLAIHEIIVEDQLVSYWEKFGAIAFDGTQKAMLTSCTLKNPDLASSDEEIPCSFSFTIRRDGHNIPSLIVGNFVPTQPLKR